MERGNWIVNEENYNLKDWLVIDICKLGLDKIDCINFYFDFLKWD